MKEGYKPKVNMTNKANPKALGYLFFGIPVLLGIFALGIPFCRYVITFGTIILTVILFLGMMASKDDREAGVKRKRPEKSGNWPKWLPHAFFVFMIVVSAGLRLGWYLIPICWLASWIFFYSFMENVRATYIEEEQEE